MLLTHVLVTTAGVQALHLTGRERLLAYAFGCAVDVDHIIKAPFYLKAVGLKEKKLGYYWRSSLQEPVALLWIFPLCLALGTAVPILFFTMHVAMDYSVRFEKMPLYPYSNWVTRGFLINVPDKVKEAIVFAVALCTNALLYFSAR
jgi:hypothetical protein